MKFIGITGGVGAGKSEVLRHIEREYPAKVLLADELAHGLMRPGTECFQKIRAEFGQEDIFLEEGGLDSAKLAKVIFSDDKKRGALNGIVHPAVKREVLRLKEEEEKKGKFAYFILEAALLIEEGYDTICDELWYVGASRQERRRRLKESRGYSDAKIDAIFDSQLSDEQYRRRCRVVIDNNGTLEDTRRQIKRAFDSEKP